MVEDDFANREFANIKLCNLFLPTVKSLAANNINTNQTLEEYLSDKPKAKCVLYVKSKNLRARNILENFISTLLMTPVVSLVFVPGFYFWIMLISFGYLFSRKKEGRILWPVLLLVVLACLSPVNGYMRYVLPVDLLSLLLVGMCFIPQKNVIIRKRTIDFHSKEDIIS